MSIISFRFLFFSVFLIGIYFLIPKKLQWVVILCANLLFYAFSGAKYLLYMLWTAFVAYIAALKIDQINHLGRQLANTSDDPEEKREIRKTIQSIRTILCMSAIIFCMGIWIVLKYGNFFLDNFNELLRGLHLNWQGRQIPFVMPLGMSFYTFHAAGYLIDIYRGKYKAEKSFCRFFTFISFFPHIIEGPFSRYDSLGTSIMRTHSFSWDRLCAGCARILWGVFKKTVIADKIGISVSAILSGYQSYSGTHILFAIFAYGIQIYADFSGYMDIMCGFSHILGISLAENFRQPYLARSVEEYWRRWHITLGKWFRDYVFYPVSMSKTAQKLGKWARKRWGAKMGKLLPGYLALLFVWTATGLWHGANWKYLVWGYLNLFAILSTMQMADWYTKIKEHLNISSDNIAWQMFCVIRTFALVCFFRLFSIADSVHIAFFMLKRIITDFHLGWLTVPHRLFVGLNQVEICAFVMGVFFLIAVDILCEIGKWEDVKAKCPMPLRNLVYTGLFFAVLLIAGGDNDPVKGFMYAYF